MSITQPVRHMTAAEVAQRLNVSQRTLTRMRKEGSGPSYMVVNARAARPTIRYMEADVMAYEESCKQTKSGGRQ